MERQKLIFSHVTRSAQRPVQLPVPEAGVAHYLRIGRLELYVTIHLHERYHLHAGPRVKLRKALPSLTLTHS